MKSEWRTEKLGDICEIYQPKTISSKEMVADGEYPVFGANGIIGKYSQYNHENSELLITCRGATCGTVNISLPKSWITGNAMVVRPKIPDLDRGYVEYFFRGAVDLAGVITGAAQPQITRQSLAPVKISFPVPSEQKRIVAILDEAFAGIDQAIANTEKNLASARELFENYLNTIFAQSEGWTKTTLSEIYDVRDGTHDSPKYQPDGYALITSKNLKPEGLSFEKVSFISEKDYADINKRSAVHKGDVLFAMIGTIGNPTVVQVEPNFAIKNVALFKVGNQRDGRFLKYYLSTKFVINKMISEAKGTTQKFVGLGYLRAFPISVPHPEEESVIIERIQEYEEKILNLEAMYLRKIASLNELKQSLLKKAFSGELTADVKDLAEAAE